MKFKRIYQALIGSVALLGFAGAANAVISLSPGTPGVIAGDDTMGPSNCEPGCVTTVFGTTGLSLLYKSDFFTLGFGFESGPFDDSYNTFFSDSIFDPADALITYDGGAAMDCPSCYLVVKDGNHDPGYYFFDLAGWNGTESINLQNFWPRGGAISHVAIWGASGPTSVPEPATLSLLGLGLLALGLTRRRKR